MHLLTRVLKNQYHDSVVLMLAARELKGTEGIIDAAYMMGTDINKDLLAQGGLLDLEGEMAGANDLILAVKCEGEHPGILDLAESLLSAKATHERRDTLQISSVRSAVRQHPEPFRDRPGAPPRHHLHANGGHLQRDEVVALAHVEPARAGREG